MMSDYIKQIGRFTIIDFEKPIFTGDYVSRVRINKYYIDKTKENGKMLVLRVPKGEMILDPKYIKFGKVFKEVFLYEDNPMKMYEIDIPHSEKKPEEYFEVM